MTEKKERVLNKQKEEQKMSEPEGRAEIKSSSIREDDALKRSVEELRREKAFLDVLCRDYTSVYFYDMNSDLLEILKLDQDANASRVLESEKLSWHKINYHDNMELYCKNYVEPTMQKDFLTALSRENILKKLSKTSRFVYRYQSRVNAAGRKYFEATVVRIDAKGFENTAILAFRHIDDIMTAEQRHQEELEEALRKERSINEILMAISKIYYAIYNIDLRKDYYEEITESKEFHHLTGTEGCASRDLMKICENIVVQEYQERMMKFFDIHTLAARLEHEETVAAEYLSKDGNWHTARFIVKRRSEDGEAEQVLYVTRLISDSKRREQNWIAIAEEANRANEAKTNFLRHMSHDIRTPINGVMGMIEMANRNTDNKEKLYECRQKVMHSMEYLLSIVNNILDIGKLESGEIVLDTKPFDMIALLERQIPFIKMQAEENDIRYDADEKGELTSAIRHRYLIGSPVHLKRILMNLAGNAMKYNKIGGTMQLQCEEIESDSEYATFRFVCADTGIGMSREFQEHAFEPFAQEGKADVSGYSGSGLGLAITKEIVDQMHGSIELESEENEGTRITVTIPFKIDREAQLRAERHEEPAVIDVSGCKALLVEDNELNREIAEMLLEDEGLVLTCAENGKEAVELFEASAYYTYDFIFMDIMMPVMNGLEATRRIREMDRPDAKTVPILAMTANAFQDDIRQSMDVGMNAHLMKPLDVSKLKKAIQKTALESELHHK